MSFDFDALEKWFHGQLAARGVPYPQEAPKPNGCSGGMDALAKAVNRAKGRGKKPFTFTFCCDEHDLFYAQGGNAATRRFADNILRQCIAQNLAGRGKHRLVQWHVPWCFWLAVRLFGWLYWSKG